MSGRGLIALAGLGSIALLTGALMFQFVGGLAPCPMCIWQRWPHAVAPMLAMAAVGLPGVARWLAAAGAATMAVSAGLGVFHAGVEQRWWEGPSTCVGPSDIGTMSAEDLMAQIMEAPLVRCDEIVWQFGLTMAGWNAVISALLCLLWLRAALRPAQLSSSASQ